MFFAASFHCHWLTGRRAAWGWLLLLVAGSLRGQAQAVRPEHRASLARVQALLGPPPAGEAASWAAPLPTKVIKLRADAANTSGFRAERQRLLAQRRQWVAEPMAFVVWERLAVDAASEQLPDTAVAYLRRALAANRQGPGYLLDAAVLNRRLSNYYWSQQAHDSALACHRREIRALLGAGLSTSSPRLVPSATGDSMCVGIALAGAYANAGLALRRRGDYAGAVRAYGQGRRYYQQLRYRAGLVWLEELLGEAYEEQGNDGQASHYYAAARRTAHAMQATEPTMAAVNLAEVLEYSHALLLRQQRAPQLLQLLAEGIATARKAWRRDTAYWRLAGIEAGLHLRAAEVRLRTGQPGAADNLRRAAEGLAVIARRAPTPPLRRHFRYYEARATELVLRHWLAHTTAQPPQPAWIRWALTYTDSLDSPAVRNALRLKLADYLVQAGEPGPAAALLPAVEASYRAARNRLKLREVYQQEAAAFAALGRWQQAYRAKTQLGQLTDSLRAAQQYAALADVEARYRTQAKEAQIAQLRERSGQEQRQKWLAWAGLGLLAGLLGGAAWVLRRTRRLNRHLEEQRAQLATQAEQLTELDRTKSVFFANVSHELRTPLTLVVGPIEHLLRQGPASWQPTVVQERLTLALRNGQRLQSLVNGLLDFSKLDAGKLVVQPLAVQAAEFFRHLFGLFADLARERGIALQSTVKVPEHTTLLFDAGKAEQVITNLLANALKFTPSGGQVLVTVAPNPAVDDSYQVTVADTGPGIPHHEQTRVFERFYQSPAHQGQGGTGIGLALSRELAGLLGGQLTLRSRDGAGSTFCFTFQAPRATDSALPLPAPTTASSQAPIAWPAPAAETAAPAGPRPRVLVVEDHADLRAYLRQILLPHYEVREAENGRVALEILAREPVDLISSDAMMPELGGIELLGHVKAHPEWRHLPFLMLTARASAEHRLSALELGVDDYLPKPFLAHELLVRVGNLLANYHERRRWRAAPDAAPIASLEAELVADNRPLTATARAVAEATEPATDEAHTLALVRTLYDQIPAILANPEYTPQLLAAALHLSERTAYRRLKELTGLTPANWLREVRLDRARQLLEAQTFPTIAEVAYEVGFLNPSHFTQLYSKRFGRKPSDY
jgi:signal transduction histidine kinase/DNA-binding response OmpR family regulator/tetratricopeptide (TPR) repeat protein